MSIRSLIKNRGELTHGSATKCPIIMSTRIRLARNLAQYPFPGWAKKSQKEEILGKCLEAAVRIPKIKNPTGLRIDELSELERQILFERHLISRELSKEPEGAGVIISQNQACSIMINEEDHLRIQVIKNGLNFKRSWNFITSIDTLLEESLDYAYSKQLGYLTACPTNVGTGLRASAMLHLPGLVISNQMEKVVRAVNQLGIAVRGIFGEGSDASGSFFQISNQQTLGETEIEILKRLNSVMTTIIEREEDAREKILEDDRCKVFDKIGRAYGVLKNGHLLSSSEAMNRLSLIRLAIDIGSIGEQSRVLVDRLFIECQPGHIQFKTNKEIEPNQRDVLRASYMREAFTKLPEPSFDHITQ
ncbi:MAG: protein arginine kinase [Verrucomicrobia bacterium]|nr:protein arginine kinase [Verrucomicrobiota bacterium]MDA1065497.1 protein arginine kinase [Verrucomicrobiota bacterium]